jgi:hypothetical protein
MTTPNRPNRRRQPSPAELQSRVDALSRWISRDRAQRMAPYMPNPSGNSPGARRTQRILIAMRARVIDAQKQLENESTVDYDTGELIHPIYGVVDESHRYRGGNYGNLAIDVATTDVETMIFTGDTENLEPELHAIVSP